MAGNQSKCIQLLAEADRTADPGTMIIRNTSYRGLLLILRITSIPGSGGLTPRVWAKDPYGVGQFQLSADPAMLASLGTFGYLFYPGSALAIAGGYKQRVDTILPSEVLVNIALNNSASYRYSLSALLLK